MTTITLHRTTERPDIELTLQDDDGTTVDLSTGYTFSFKVGTAGSAATFTKTTGITGAATAPNLTMTFVAGELDDVTRGRYMGQVTATTSSLDRVWQFNVEVRDVIT